MSEKKILEITNPKDIIYSEKDKIGSGSIGNVFRGTCRGSSVAIKVPNKPKSVSKFSEEFVESFKNEVKSLQIYHPRIALLMGAYISSKSILLVNELLDGNIQEKILKTESLNQKSVWLKQVAEGMSWLHGYDMIHGDLKPSNLLYHAKTHSIKICDFGVMKMKQMISENDLGETLLYTAPEVENNNFSKGSDVYSFGQIIYFFVTGKHPESNKTHELPNDELICPNALRELANSCWEPSQLARPTFENILKKFDGIILDCTILCKEGREFWYSSFKEKSEVKWAEFMNSLAIYIKNEKIKPSGSAEFKVLKKLFHEVKGIVTLSHFGETIGFFEKFGAGDRKSVV